MTIAFRCAVSFAMLLAPVATFPGHAGEPSGEKSASAGKPDKPSARKPRVAVTISRETTYITAPLRKDRYVDYVAALNERCSRGVTPENNPAVLFWKAVGPEKIPKANREQFFKMLGIPPLPEKGDYFVALDEYVKRLQDAGKLAPLRPAKEVVEDLSDQYCEAMERAWSEKDFPVLAGWLAANEKPLTLLTEAYKRPRRYHPMICGDMIAAGAISEEITLIQRDREFARLLLIRARLRLGDGRVEEAWEDLLSCHRLARLVAQGPFLVDALVAVVLDGMACSGDHALLQNVRFTAAQAAKMRDDLGRLPSLRMMANVIDVGERFSSLDCVSMAARDGLASLGMLLDDGRPGEVVKPLVNLSARAAINWDEILRMTNSWYDRMLHAYHKPSRAERREAMRRIDRETSRLAQEAKELKFHVWSTLADPRRTASKRLGQILLHQIVPSISAAADAEDRAAMRFDLTKLAFALAAFRADHGAYPAKLADLVPKYVAQLPKDIVTAADLHYRKTADGYVLYSVGQNGKDDGGKGYDDRKRNEDWDDLVIRVPGPAKQPRQEKKGP